ncbi:MAG TPA: hypothetical protein VMS43_14045 [Allosphingosinicella sp.]|nr:hypothetical protein [Allosphingosinicella sp.]
MSGDRRSVVHSPPLQRAKAATKALVRAAGGQEAAAADTGKSQARLSAYGVPNAPDFAPIDVVVALEGITHGLPGHPHVTRYLAGEAGFLLVPKPQVQPGNSDWCLALAAAVADFGDVQDRLLRAMPGGVTAQEVRDTDIRREIAEAMERLACLDALAALALEQE